MPRNLVLIPVFNEEKHIRSVLEETLPYGYDVLVVDDGSTDSTAEVLSSVPGIYVQRKDKNAGYGAALITGFAWAAAHRYETVVTMDSDGQHLPSLLPAFFEQASQWDIVSGSRYLAEFDIDTPAPRDRRRVNMLVTDQLNAALGLSLTDSFCGFKAYRVARLAELDLREPGYGMPLELWIRAVCRRLRITEIAVPRVYLDPNRSFGEALDDSNRRLAYYQDVIDRTLARSSGVSDGPCRPVRPILVAAP